MSAIIAPVLTPTVSDDITPTADGSTVNNVPGTVSTVQIGMVIYDNTPGSNMSELEQMKAMMEQMRLEKEQMRLEKEQMRMEKERYEMEAMRREEEAAMALRMEQEREMAIKEKKELDVVFSLFRDSPYISYSPDKSNIDYTFENAGEEECKFLRSLEASGETILCVKLDMSIMRCPHKENSEKKGVLTIVLTNCHLYKCTYTKTVKTSTSPCDLCRKRFNPEQGFPQKPENCHSLKTGIFYASKLYSFTNPLNLVHAKILSYIMTIQIIETIGYVAANRSLWDRMPCIDSLKKFESIIRLIPGSYKNGSWRQLDGFFGMYFNETTMELSEVPPPL